MHVMIINGSPRIQKYSNTDKIISAFERGLVRAGATCEKYAISEQKSWDDIRDAYEKNTNIIIALPLYVECVPGLLLQFLETLPQKENDTQLSFILQGGFAEGCQFRCGEEFLKELPGYLGCSYGGCLVKGDNFSIRLTEGEEQEKMTEPYEKMGELFVRENSFDNAEARAFTGPEYYPLLQRLIVGFAFKTIVRKIFRNAAQKWGCTEPLDTRPYEK